MTTTKTILPSVLALVAGLSITGEAAASVYGGARFLVNDFNIITTDANSTFINPTTYSFRITNTAQLNNGAPVVTAANCGGTFLAGTTCSAAPPILDALPADIGGGRVNNAFTYLGPGLGEYASSDSVIQDAQLVNPGNPTVISQIAESEIQGGVQAFADSTITSQTDYVVNFSIPGGLVGPWQLVLSFEADPDLLASINDATAATAQARASIAASFTLSQTAGGSGNVSWAPQGDATNNCLASAGINCNEDNDGEDLNVGVSTATLPVSQDGFSRFADVGGGLDSNGDPADQGFSMFGITVTGLTAGDWSLRLTGTVTSDVNRTVAMPEPGLLGLLGIGLGGLGAVRLSAGRRKKKA